MAGRSGNQKIEQQQGKNEVHGALCEDRGIWVIRARVWDPVAGKFRQRSRSTGLRVADHTRRRAQALIAETEREWQAEQDEAVAASKRRGLESFGEYVEQWLKGKRLTVRPNSLKSYRDYAQKHILPRLGSCKVRDITWRRLQEFYDGLLQDHALSSVKKIAVVITGSLDDAVRDGAIDHNPSSLVKWPREAPRESRAFSRSDAVRLLEIAERAEEPMRAAIILALCYGLRRSEVCGLRWMDIDFERGILHVRHTVVQNGTLVLDTDNTKSKKSNRVLGLIPATVPYLRQLRAAHLSTGSLGKVVRWPNGDDVRPDGITEMFRTLLRRNGMAPMRFHDLRHLSASLLAGAGVSPLQLQRFLGHSSISMTMGIYTHLLSEDAEKTSAAMDQIIVAAAECSGNCSGSGTIVKIG